MFTSSIGQYGDLGLLVLRFALGFIFLYHAYPKLSRAQSMAGMFGGRVWAVQLLGAVELLAAVGVITGIYFFVSTCALAVLMVGAIYMKVVKWNVPFSAMDKMGWEFDLILLAAAVALHLGGGGFLFFLM